MYKVVAIGGTFDRLHKGHRAFISEAFKKGQKILVGITSDTFAARKIQIPKSKNQTKSKFQNPKLPLQSYKLRLKEVKRLLNDKGLLQRVEVVKIDDVYGPLIERNEVEALVVTKETLQGAKIVNKARKLKGLNPIRVVTVPLINAQDQRRISSTRIREGEIDRWGKVMKYQISKIKNKISGTLRLELKKPLGKLHGYFRPEKIKPLFITVGDAVTKTFLDAGITPDISVVDFHIQRKRIYTHLSELGFSPAEQKPAVKVQNPAGFVTKLLVNAVERSVKQILAGQNARIILVEGEEDLAGLPAILLTPLGARVYYGQPGEGVVEVVVTEEKKKELVEMIEKYSV